MALTVTSRGTGTHNTGATTLVPGGRTATLAAGSMGVFCIAVDNAGSAGAATICPTSWTDAKGNVWTRRINALYDNGAASAGIEMGFYTAPITVALLTTDLGTITWDGGVSPVAKAFTWYEVIPSGGNTVSYSTGGNIAGATAANAQVVTASVLVGDAVIAGYFSENVGAVTGDSDSTNGSWTAQQTATIGATTSGVRIATQQKVQTTTASTQSYDVTVASQDRIAGYIMLHEVVNTTVTPTTLAVVTATFAPTVTASNHQSVTPTTKALTTSTFAPTVIATANQLITPSTASLTTARFAPTVTASDHQRVTPSTTALSTSTFASTVTASDHQRATPTTASLSLTAFAPIVTAGQGVTVTPSTASLTATTFAPTVTATAHVTVTPATASLTTATFAPTVAATDHKVVILAPASVTLAAFAPTVTAPNPQLVIPSTASLTTATFAPSVLAGVTARPTTATLALASFAPNVLLSDNQLVTPAAASLALASFAPEIIGGDVSVTPAVASLILATFAPTVLVPPPVLRGVIQPVAGVRGALSATGLRGSFSVSRPSGAVSGSGELDGEIVPQEP